jgi:cysteine-rich repeat protein
MRKLGTWGVLAVLLPAFAGADVLPVGPEFRVNTYTTAGQYFYRTGACGNPTGDFVVVWQSETQDGANYGIFGQRFRDAAPLGAEFRVNAYTTGNQTGPNVACLPDGTFFAVWTDATGRDGSGEGLFGRRLDRDGLPFGTEFQVNTYTPLDQDVAQVIPTRDGVLVVWEGVDADEHGVSGQRFASDGTRVGTEFQLNTYTSGYQSEPFPAADDTGGFVVVWTGLGQDGDGRGTLARRWGSDGMPTGTEFVVNTYATGEQIEPVVARTPTGFVAAWETPGSSGRDVVARRLDAAAAPLGTEFRVNTYVTGNQLRPSVASDARGGLVFTWSSAAQDGSGHGIFGQRYASDGTVHGTEFRVNSYTTGEQGFYTVPLVDADGDFLVVWNSEHQDGDSFGPHARLFRDACGDATVGAGEACDDGSRLPGDCCSETCQPLAGGTACAADGVDCTTDACDGAGSCGHAAVDAACPACRRCDATTGCVARPRTDCRRPTRARQASLALTNKSPDRKDRLEYAWKRGAETTPADFGALPASPDYTVCIFDRAGGSDRLVLDATAPAGGGWKKKGAKGFRYRSAGGAPDGVTSVVLQSGRAGKASAAVSGKGAALGLPTLGLTPPVSAQLQAGNGAGACFGAEFATSQKNTATTFRAKGQ